MIGQEFCATAAILSPSTHGNRRRAVVGLLDRWTVGRYELLGLKNRRQLDAQLSLESDKLTAFKLQRIFKAPSSIT
jgi:hypothetical protein